MNNCAADSDRPFVVCHMVASLDGRISGSWFRLPETKAALAETSHIRSDYSCDALINGAVTCAEIYADGTVKDLPQAKRSFNPAADRMSGRAEPGDRSGDRRREGTFPLRRRFSS